eukprot:scaffold232316_cov39-Tisochrysis_lutea.AAC.3
MSGVHVPAATRQALVTESVTAVRSAMRTAPRPIRTPRAAAGAAVGTSGASRASDVAPPSTSILIPHPAFVIFPRGEGTSVLPVETTNPLTTIYRTLIRFRISASLSRRQILSWASLALPRSPHWPWGAPRGPCMPGD